MSAWKSSSRWRGAFRRHSPQIRCDYSRWSQRQRMGRYYKNRTTLTPLVLYPHESLKQANTFTGSQDLTEIVNWPRFLLHRTLNGHRTVQAVAFKEWLLSEAMPRTPALLLPWKRQRIRGQIFSSLILPFFSRARAQAVALQRQPPWARLRTVCRDWGDGSVKEQEECRNSSLCSAQEKEVRRKRTTYTCG